MQALIDALPVTAHRAAIVAAIRAHPVVIVCGETGSGKTTQLPKLCLEAGRGRRDPRRRRGGLIGHTQPRRLAATSVAARIAEELGTPLGVDVGYKIRFNEKVAPGARIKLMTDGILLAETQGDPLLSRYDTIIVDEAHERSLNIDFLLGYLKRLVDGPRRDDLKLVITSATIDAERFARHFGGAAPAPVIEVSGRLYPVEIRYRPFAEAERRGRGERSAGARGAAPAPDDDDETDLPSAVEAALDELWGEAPGDVLVFLPGEREIRDCADHLRRAAARAARTRAGRLLAGAEIVPLFARLSAADQQRVFAPGAQPRIVLATNVAETSLTVPRIRYVIDSGLARVRRYRIRGKIDQLLIEPVSQAAASQRAGRCGRVADGVCVRLYDEDDHARRPRFTDPEILRSSLAGVILRMRALGLPDVAAFPFLDPPSPKAIADGYALLLELGAIDERRELTAVGRQLARLPVDPRIARMLLAGHELGCLADVVVVASGLSVQDPRERPVAQAQAADQAHARFADPRSDFLGWIRLWRYWQAQQDGRAGRGESHRALAARLTREFLSIRRLREWADVHGQLCDLVRELGWRLTPPSAAKPGAIAPGEPAVPVQRPRPPLVGRGGARGGETSSGDIVAAPDPLHRALLTGLLGNVGTRIPDDDLWQGAHQQKFRLHPSSGLGRRGGAAAAGGNGTAAPAAGGAAAPPTRAGRWIMAAEMVDTGRLQARTAATVRPEWIEAAAGPLVARSWSEPHWEKKAGQVIAQERGVLYGLVLYAGRRVPYGDIDPALARTLMIREGLVAGEWPSELPFIRHNRAVVAEIERLEHKIRRPDLLVDETALAAWFDARIPADLRTAQALERWWRDARRTDPTLLQLSRDALLRKDAEGVDDRRFPKGLAMHGVDFALDYRFEPGSSDDGVTMTVPLYALNQVDAVRCEWLVPGMLPAKVELLLKSLPQRYRRHLLPLAETAAGFVADSGGAGSSGAGDADPGTRRPLLDVLTEFVRGRGAPAVRPDDFRLEAVPSHLMMNFRVVDEHGGFLAMSRQLPQLRADFGGSAQSSFQAAFARVAGRVATVAGTGAAAATAAGATGAATGTSAAAVSASAAVPDVSAAAAGKAAGAASAVAAASAAAVPEPGSRHVRWDFGALPELLEAPAPDGGTIVGFPALVDRGDAVELAVFDAPETAARRHRDGVVRLFALALAEPVRALERDLKRNAGFELQFGTLPVDQSPAGPLAAQLVAAAIERSCLADGLPVDAASFDERVVQGRSRFLLTAQELIRLLQAILAEYGVLRRKLAVTRNQPHVQSDIAEQLAGLFTSGFLRQVPFETLAHYPRYLKAVIMRLDKLREQPQRDQQAMAEMAPLLARWQRRSKALRGEQDSGFESFRWLLEELRVSLFAQSLRTPVPVSVKRLTRMLDQKEAQ
ncbi:MAG: ATP-dependent RNA helicase HrpA [Lautropia sp.]